MADIGSLVVKLAAETSEFQADLGRSARLLDKHASEMKASLESVANVAKTAFAVAVGVTSVAAIRDFIAQTIEAASALQGLAEQSGASVEALSGFAPVATISGTSLENIGGSLAKLSKGLAGIDEETAGATKALKFLGITAKDSSGNLRDPAEVMNDIALKLAEFEDGAGKTAIAIELFGKSGASMIPFLKDLAENQDLNIRLTAQQIEEADNAAKALARMKAEANFVAQTIVTTSIPAMTVLAQELAKVFFGSDDAVKGIQKLRTDGTLTNWAENTAYALAVVIDALRGIGNTIKSVIGSFQAVWADIELAGTFLAGGEGLNPFSEENRAKLKAALDRRNEIVRQSNQNYVDLWNMPLLADSVKKRFEEIRAGADAANKAAESVSGPRKQLNYNLASGSNAANALAAMENQVKELERSVGEESSLLKDRQRIIDLYEQAGYISFKDATDARVAAQEDFVEKIRALYLEQQMLMEIALRTEAKTTQDKLKLQDKLAEIAVKREKLERDAAQSNLERIIRQPAETLKDLQDQAQRGQLELSAIEEQIKTQRENRAITEIESLNKLADARARSAEQLRMLADQAREISEAAPGNDKLADSFRRIEEAARRAGEAAETLRQRAKELSDPAAGVSKGLKDVAEEAAQVGKQMEDATRRAFNGMTDALTEFVMTGKLNFRSLALSIIQDLIRIQIQSAIVGPLAKAIGSMFSFGGGAGAGSFQTDFNTFSAGNTAFAANGGIIGSRGHMPLNYFAKGGIANSPQLAVFGEGSRPEAFVPLPDGRSIPVTMNGGIGGSTSVVVNVNVESGQASTVGEGEGASLGKLIASAVQSEIIRQKRNGGLLAGA